LWLVDQGLRWAGTPREVAEAADVVLTSLPNDDVVASVAAGPDGIVAGLNQGKRWADLSTISPRASRALAERVRKEGRGAHASSSRSTSARRYRRSPSRKGCCWPNAKG
jgi:3-hydroxyisobutyrate dehydrogenase-like beta-hydroxyacid dehydrogenase